MRLPGRTRAGCASSVEHAATENDDLGSLSCVHDPALWRAAEIVKRVAGYQRQISAGRLPQHQDVGRTDDLDIRDGVTGGPLWRSEFDNVVGTNQPERSKVGVAMRGDPEIAVLVRKRCRRNVPRPLLKNGLVVSLEDHNRHIEAGYGKSAYHIAAVQARLGRVRSLWGRLGSDRSLQPFLRVSLRTAGRALHAVVITEKCCAPNDEGASQAA